jgi:hypothetical protein
VEGKNKRRPGGDQEVTKNTWNHHVAAKLLARSAIVKVEEAD